MSVMRKTGWPGVVQLRALPCSIPNYRSKLARYQLCRDAARAELVARGSAAQRAASAARLAAEQLVQAEASRARRAADEVERRSAGVGEGFQRRFGTSER